MLCGRSDHRLSNGWLYEVEIWRAVHELHHNERSTAGRPENVKEVDLITSFRMDDRRKLKVGGLEQDPRLSENRPHGIDVTS